MDQRIQDELQMLIDIITGIVPVEQIFLFGSYATGIPHADSDLDIFVVIKEDVDIREIDAMKLINKAIRDKKTMPVDVIVSKKSKSSSSFFLTIVVYFDRLTANRVY